MTSPQGESLPCATLLHQIHDRREWLWHRLPLQRRGCIGGAGVLLWQQEVVQETTRWPFSDTKQLQLLGLMTHNINLTSLVFFSCLLSHFSQEKNKKLNMKKTNIDPRVCRNQDLLTGFCTHMDLPSLLQAKPEKKASLTSNFHQYTALWLFTCCLCR